MVCIAQLVGKQSAAQLVQYCIVLPVGRGHHQQLGSQAPKQGRPQTQKGSGVQVLHNFY